MQTGRWHDTAHYPKLNDATFNTYTQLKDELTIGTTTQVILCGTRLVIPRELQRRVVDLAHEGHQGITKTKALLREKVWFPGINELVEQRIKSCHSCQVATPTTTREPLQMSPLPEQVWQEISVDFAELPTGHYLLLISDDYSSYPNVEVLHSITAQTVIPKLKKIFAELGVSEVSSQTMGPHLTAEPLLHLP